MSAERPRIDPALLADLLDAAPARVRRKLDAAPRGAEEWPWTPDGAGWSVAAGTETVRLAGSVLTASADLGCSCLLTPRCLHLLSVVSLLSSTGDEHTGDEGTTGAGPEPVGDAAPPAADPSAEAAEIGVEARNAARLAWTAGARALAHGVAAAGSAQRAGLLRASGLARAARLPRLAAACTTVAAGLRDHGTPAFDLAGHVRALTGLLDTAWRLGGGPEGPRPAPTRAEVGIGRRGYGEVGSLRLYGLACERVVAASGYAGVVTHAVSSSGGRSDLWRIGDVAPGGADRVAAAYGAAVDVGGLTVSHRDLVRGGLVAQRLTASADGRLGGGAATTAAAAEGRGWHESPLAQLWGRPLAEQIGPALAALASPAARTGADLVFVDLTVTGPAEEGAVVVETGSARPLLLLPQDVQDTLRARNLARLAAEPGLALRVVARPLPARPGALVPVSVAVGQGIPLPGRLRGVVNLSLDTLPAAPASVPAGPEEDRRPAPSEETGLDRFARALARLAEAGREAAPDRGPLAALLADHHLPTAAALLGAVDDAARERVRTVTGESVVPPPDGLALAWLAASAYLDAARARLRSRAWSEALR